MPKTKILVVQDEASIRSERAVAAQRILKAVLAHMSISEDDAFQLRFWVSPEEASLTLEAIALLILERKSNSGTAG